MTTGEKIKTLRLLRGYDQKDLAFGLGLKAATSINRWEQGVTMPRTGVLQKLGEELEINWPWLQDSRMAFSNNSFVYFRPLTPYIAYTDRWTTYLSSALPGFFVDLCNELAVTEIFGFDAPCGGGTIAAVKERFAIMVVCRPELYPSLREMISPLTRLSITDYEYAEQLFKGTRTKNFLDLCGISWVQEEQYEEKPSLPTVSISLHATLPANSNVKTVKKKLLDQINDLSSRIPLQEVSLHVSVRPSRSTKEIITALIEEPYLKNLAKLL